MAASGSRRIDLGRGDDDVERLAGERGADDIDEAFSFWKSVEQVTRTRGRSDGRASRAARPAVPAGPSPAATWMASRRRYRRARP